jgi:N-methylhydantoinase B
MVGGMGARATKDGLNTTGFPSGVAGVPAEVIETLSPLIQLRRQLRTDSGGAGKFRGGLGQSTEIACRGGGQFSLSAMIDRTRFAAQGLAGGAPGAIAEYKTSDGKPLQPKTVLYFTPDMKIHLNPAGGGGYGDPCERDVEKVLSDVINGYVSIEQAEKQYGVTIRYIGNENQLVRLPHDYKIVSRQSLSGNTE